MVKPTKKEGKHQKRNSSQRQQERHSPNPSGNEEIDMNSCVTTKRDGKTDKKEGKHQKRNSSQHQKESKCGFFKVCQLPWASPNKVCYSEAERKEEAKKRLEKRLEKRENT